jgi:hypothetical protein
VTRYRFELAEPSDDAALRRVMAQTPMPGGVTLSFEREPNYFASNSVLGLERQTIACRDTESRQIVGLATRSVREMFVAGEKQRVGYLGGLRIMKHARNRGLLARGYRFVRELHESDPNAPPFYLTTVADGNAGAIEPLTSRRAGLPTYHPLGRLHTLVLPIHKQADDSESFANCEISNVEDLEQLIDFLNCHGSGKTFFPAYQHADFVQPDGTFRDLDTSSIVVAKRNDKIIGAAGIWDQRRFRQTIVHGYSSMTGMFRPLVNQWSRLTAGIQLPRIGQPFNACFVCFPIVVGDDGAVFRALLRRLMRMAPAGAPCMLLGLCPDDPLHQAAAAFSRMQYTTLLYAVSWDKIPAVVTDPTSKPHYLELGCL